MIEATPERTIDARGLRCPLPALRLARTIRELGQGRYRLRSDDPAARHDIPLLCSERGWALVSADDGDFIVQAG